MKLKILATAHHRNGVAGTPFDVVLFKVLRERGAKVGILFDDPGLCAVLDVTMLAAGDIAFGSNSWRGDDYESSLRRSLPSKPDHPAPGETPEQTNEFRVRRCDSVLAGYGDPCSLSENLIDLLTDAMHWSDASCEDFHYALCVAGKHYLAELNDEQTQETRLP